MPQENGWEMIDEASFVTSLWEGVEDNEIGKHIKVYYDVKSDFLYLADPSLSDSPENLVYVGEY